MEFSSDFIKASLKYCAAHDDTCEECPCVRENCKCIANDLSIVLDLINRQDAEIEEQDKAIINALQHMKKVKVDTIKSILASLEAEAESSDKFIREYDGSSLQVAYNKALWKACRIVRDMMVENDGE